MSKEVNSIPGSANLEINFSNQELRQENWFPETDFMLSNYEPSNSVDITNSFHDLGENLGPGSRVCGPSRISSVVQQGQFRHLLAMADAAAQNEFKNPVNGVSSFSYLPVYKPQFDTGRYEASSATSSPAKQDVPYGLASWGNSGCVPDMNLNGNPTPTRFIYDLNSPPTPSMDAFSTKNLPSYFAPITPDHSRKSDYGNAIQTLNLDGKTTQVHDTERDRIATTTRVETNELLDKEMQQLPKDLSSIDNPEIDLNKTPQKKPKRKKHRPKIVTEGKPKRTPKPATPKPPKEDPTTKRKYVRKTCKRVLNFEEVSEERNVCFESQAQNFFTRVESTSRIQLDEGLDIVVENTQAGLAYDLNRSINKAVKEYISLPERDTRINPQTPIKNDPNRDRAKGKSPIVFSDEAHDRQARGLKRENLQNVEDQIVIGGNCNPVPQFLAMFQENPYNGSNAIPGMHFPTVYKKKRTEKIYCSTISSTVHDVNTYVAPHPTYYMDSCVNEQNLECELGAVQIVKMTKKRSKVPTRVRDFSSLMGTVECGQFPSFHNGKAPVFGDVQKCGTSNNSPESIQTLVAQTQVTMQKKKRTKRLSFTTCTSTGVLRKKPSTVEEITELLERLDLNSERNQARNRQKRELAPFNSQFENPNALVVYQRDGTIVPFTGAFQPVKKRKPRPKVDIDEETNKVWRLLLENINNEGIDGTDDEKAKWWDEERRVFQGRADSFIARMHLVQGDRRFSPWKGSVLDSVVGVFLTQNVSDHLSSSAFMSLAARFPLGSKGTSSPSDEGTSTVSKEPEVCFPDLEDTIHTQGETSNNIAAKEVANDNESLGKPMKSNFLGIFGKGLKIDDNTISNREAIKKPWECSVREREIDDVFSTQFSAGSSKESVDSSFAQTSFVELLQMAASSRGHFSMRRADVSSNESAIMGEAARLKSLEIVGNESEQSGVTAESVSHVMFQNNNNGVQVDVESCSKAINVKSSDSSKRKGKSVKQQKESTFDWDRLRVEAQAEGKRGERRADTMDSLDWEAVRCAPVNDIADAIKERGMNNKLAERIQDMLNRLVDEHGSTEIEWLRDVPPDKAKEYLLSIRGLGLKSVECVRLLTLHHLAFPVDTNVGRIAVRLGWVPLQPLPESLQLHLLELYPVLNSIQRYLWPRLCKLDQRTLYELHYQMITFGKVFCTKSKPNCNACPMRGECRHFASAFASARLALPSIDEKSLVNATEMKTAYQNPAPSVQQLQLPSSQNRQQCGPTIELPSTPEPIVEVPASPEFEEPEQILDFEDIICDDPDEIPMIKLNLEEFTQTLQNYMHHNMELQEGDVSKALVALTPEAASIPTPKLKNVNRLRTEHSVYELPDSHPLLEGLDKREPDDPCSYLLAIWTPGETANSITPPEGKCRAQEVGSLCDDTTCFSCNSIREANSQTVRGTLLIPCRTAMRGSFPLNGTYFQVNEVFADHDSSINPIDVPRSWIWNLPRRTVYFGTSIPSIFKGLSTESIQYCFWRGFVCVRGFDQTTRGPRPLMARLHFPASKLPRTQGKPTNKQERQA